MARYIDIDKLMTSLDTVQWSDVITRGSLREILAKGASSGVLVETTTAYLCDDCEAVSEEAGEGPIYECGSCGEEFTRENSNNGANQCPSCYKMAGKKTDGDRHCIECERGGVEEIEAVSLEGELMSVEAFEEKL